MTKQRKVTALTGVTLLLVVSVLAVSLDRASGPSESAAQGTSSAAVDDAHAGGTGQLVVDWNRELLKLEKTPGAQPTTIHPTRSFALLQAAVYDAVVSAAHAGSPYAFDVVAAVEARPDAAADRAAHDVLRALFPSFAPELDRMLTDEMSAVPPGRGRDAGIAAGARVATLMLALRADDGSAIPPPPFVPRTQPGGYRATPPNTGKQPAYTAWGAVTPWVLDTGSQFRPAAPPPLTSEEWARAIDEVHRLGGGQESPSDGTADQAQIGLFWAPPIWNTWNEIADDQITARGSNLATASRVLADLDLTVADSVIALYDAKYTYAFWRPITAIRAGTPSNPGVDAADPRWNPLAPTAPDPSYPGAHATVSAAAAAVLTRLFGPDVDITVHSDAAGFTNVTRTFRSFDAAADEAAQSRIFAGQHTTIDETAGTRLGRDVAGAVLVEPFGQR